MKRKRCEMEKRKKKTEIRSAIEELAVLIITKSGDNMEAINIPLKPLLSFCNLVIQFLDKIGPTMAVLRQDIDQNIKRIEKLCESDPPVYSNLVEILKKEKEDGVSKKANSCSRSLLWLTRTMDFTAALLQRLANDTSQNMEQATEECYVATLKPWHGWISSAAFRVALKLVPDYNTLINALSVNDESFEIETLQEDMATLTSFLVPVLQDIHSVLELYDLDRLKST